jgi:hypothetical protein
LPRGKPNLSEIDPTPDGIFFRKPGSPFPAAAEERGQGYIPIFASVCDSWCYEDGNHGLKILAIILHLSSGDLA